MAKVESSDIESSEVKDLRNLAGSVSMSTLESLTWNRNPELQTELIASIYPGAEITTKLGKSREKYIVRYVRYNVALDEAFPEINIRSADSEEIHTLYLNVKGEIEMKSPSTRFRPTVHLRSLPNMYIKLAWQTFDRHVFYTFVDFDFDYELHCNFAEFIKDRWDEFAIFATREQREFLMEQLEGAFMEEPTHSSTCSDTTYCFDGEHLCEPTDHLLILLNLAMDTRNLIVPTKKACLGGVSIINKVPQYVHITPGGSFITGSFGENKISGNRFMIDGHGTCRHPLTRILFWTVLLKFRPEFEQLYLRQYHAVLLNDLSRYRFGTGETLSDLVSNFNTNLSLVTCSTTTHVILYPVRSWGDQPVVETKMYEYEHRYHLHLLILALLRDGWKGTTKIYYCGNKITFTMETCQRLLQLPTREATQAYIKKIAPSIKYDTDTSD